MTLKEFIFLVKEVLQNWQVTGTLIVMLLVLAFTNFVIKYRKKPKKAKKKNTVVSAPAPQVSAEAMPAPDVE